MKQLLPILFMLFASVLCRAQTTRLVTFPLHQGPYSFGSHAYYVPGVTGAQYLWVKTFNLSWAGKGSVRLNNGSWITLNNTTCAVQGNAANYGGIGGFMFKTLDFRIAVATLGTVSSTQNKIEFRFNNSDGNSSSYDVLDADFLSSIGARLLPAGSLAYGNPTIEPPPAGMGPSDVTLGHGYFTARDTLLSDIQTRRVPIHASCADCHAGRPGSEGGDLRYFNFGNTSIIHRSLFHGLTNLKSTRIAAYIKSLTNYRSLDGRPWNPVYQPGPGLDSRPREEWAAGAGINAVLAQDKDMVAYCGTGAFPYTTDTNMREMPISLPLLTWTDWLPKRHGLDNYSDFAASTFNTLWHGNGRASVEDDLAGFAATDLPNGHWKQVFLGWCSSINSYINSGSNQVHAELVAAGGNPTLLMRHAKNVYDLGLLMQVKTWEAMNTAWLGGQNLQDQPQYTSTVPFERQTWPKGGAVFLTSPGKRGFQPGVGVFSIDLPSGIIHDTPTDFQGVNVAWYWITAVVTGNMRADKLGDHNPIDWPYFNGRMKDLDLACGIWRGAQAFVLYQKMLQTGRGVGVVCNDPSSNGFSILTYGRPDTNLLLKEAGLPAYGDAGSISNAQRIAMVTSEMDATVTVGNLYPVSSYYGTNTISTGPSVASVVTGQVNFPGSMVLTLRYSKTLGVNITTRTNFKNLAQAIFPTNGTNWTGLL